MGKSILVIDTPSSCRHCALFGSALCREAGASPYNLPKPNQCPLRDIPYRLSEKEPFSACGVYAKGWNACIKKIMRGAVEIE